MSDEAQCLLHATGRSPSYWLMKKSLSRLFAGECIFSRESFLCAAARKYFCYGKTWWLCSLEMVQIILFHLHKMSKPQLYVFCCCCFKSVFPLAVHSLREQEVRQQVKPTPAFPPAAMLPWSGKGQVNRGWLLLTSIGLVLFHFTCSNWCLFLAASVHCMSMTENGAEL